MKKTDRRSNNEKILLIGDSVRLGYDIYVEEALKGVAKLYYPNENCMYAQHVLRFLDIWKGALKIDEDLDLIHWNTGLWDCLVMDNDGPLTPIDTYGQFIERICKRINYLFPNAKAIFATSTNTVESRYDNPKVAYRKNSITAEYNKVAVEIVKKYGHQVNDLFEATKDIDDSYFVDSSHPYTEKGTILLVERVLSSIKNSLDLDIGVDVTALVKGIQSKIDMTKDSVNIVGQLRDLKGELGI